MMANHDVKNDVTPLLQFKPISEPTISELRTALLTVNGGASYTAERLNTMTRNDMIYAARVHSLSVNGL
jgi:hypothetical protein